MLLDLLHFSCNLSEELTSQMCFPALRHNSSIYYEFALFPVLMVFAQITIWDHFSFI